MPSVCPQDIASSCDYMTNAVPVAKPEPEINDWSPSHETPTLHSFAQGGPLSPESQEKELSEMLTRKFREFFP